MSNLKRNPRNFPKMKVRGARRRRLAPWQRLAGSFDALADSTRVTSQAMMALAVAWRKTQLEETLIPLKQVTPVHHPASEPLSARSGTNTRSDIRSPQIGAQTSKEGL